MIVRFASFAGRRLFDLALVAFLLGAGLLYLSFRLLRWTVKGLPPTPKRDAAFAVLITVVGLARTLGANKKPAPPEGAGDAVASVLAAYNESHGEGGWWE